MNNSKIDLSGLAEFIKDPYGEYKNINNINNFVRINLKDNDGFIVYSKNKINENIWFDKKQKEKQLNNGTKTNPTLKDLKENKEDYALRLYYYLKIKEQEGKHITIFMLNPAFAYSGSNDTTISRIKNNILKNHDDISSFDIINISPIRNPYPNRLNVLEQKDYYDKGSYYSAIEKIIENSDQILLAWGSGIDKLQISEKLYQILNANIDKITVLGISDSNNPYHPLARKKHDWQFTKEIKKINFSKENIKIEIK